MKSTHINIFVFVVSLASVAVAWNDRLTKCRAGHFACMRAPSRISYEACTSCMASCSNCYADMCKRNKAICTLRQHDVPTPAFAKWTPAMRECATMKYACKYYTNAAWLQYEHCFVCQNSCFIECNRSDWCAADSNYCLRKMIPE